METAGLDSTGAVGSQPEATRKALIAASIFASIATVTGTFLYCYPSTMKVVRDAMVLTHDVSGDLTIAAAVVYLWLHLKRTWRMWRFKLSRRSGYVAVAAWLTSGATGVYGQLTPMPAESPIGLVHMFSSVIAIVLASAHAYMGLKRHFR